MNVARVTLVDHASGLNVPAVLHYSCPFGVNVLTRDGRPTVAARHWCDIAARCAGAEALGTDDFHHIVNEINGTPYAW